MPDQTQQRAFLHAVESALADEDQGYARYRRSRRRVKRPDGKRSAQLEYDESGFPLPQDRPGFAKRVARLLNA